MVDNALTLGLVHPRDNVPKPSPLQGYESWAKQSNAFYAFPTARILAARATEDHLRKMGKRL